MWFVPFNKKISPADIEYYLLEETDIAEFTNKLHKSEDVLDTIINVSMVLYRKGQFNDNAKMNAIRQIAVKPKLFT